MKMLMQIHFLPGDESNGLTLTLTGSATAIMMLRESRDERVEAIGPTVKPAGNARRDSMTIYAHDRVLPGALGRQVLDSTTDRADRATEASLRPLSFARLPRDPNFLLFLQLSWSPQGRATGEV